MLLKDAIASVSEGNDLKRETAEAVARSLADASVPGEHKKAILLALAEKGEVADEVAAFASVFQDLATNPGLSGTEGAIDVVGTGGDRSGSFNISTTSAIILAASGVPVVKHGNRSVTSKCGSADFLEALGINLKAPQTLRQRSFDELNFVFLFAPAFHPAFKEVVPIRKELAAEGKRTIFNLLGPLINPGRPDHLLMGVFSASWVSPLAEALGSLKVKSGLVVNSAIGEGGVMDEFTCAGANRVCGVGTLNHLNGTISPVDAGLSPCAFDDLKGGDVAQNLKMLDALLDGSAPQGLIDTICLNVGAALWITDRADDLSAGVKQANEILQSGVVSKWLERVKAVYQK
ncbi:anthranilate phosphoribosyltransferase [Rubellicoccus peritrichatus]|uniref:Anthranilate phosphoribosyltransferase n=1 Tax=Rubellicoccus peritrichatus TaxID=3080537 RepID=A0AAQ3L703_9BACT|nr:anthranilate phosphoribosyltransferase [Puniceicoccus sp. CR14]WOO39822.1 anthranilate phosphoribosyltransferase [Puniceicoccus sp. CR14]